MGSFPRLFRHSPAARGAGAGIWLERLMQDLRFSLRQLIKSPGFTLTALISLALGIGATAAVFSVIYAALMNPFPYKDANRIVRLVVKDKAAHKEWISLNSPQIQQLRKSPALEDLVAMDSWSLTLTGHDLPQNVDAIYITSNGFNFLGMPPLLGRGIVPSDAIDGRDPQPVVVLSYKFWQRHFNSNPAVLGQVLQLDRKDYTVVGVAGPRFTWYSGDVFLPLKLDQDPVPIYMVDLRLPRGESHAAADAAIQPLMEQFAKDTPKHFPEHFRVRLEGLNEWVTESVGGTLYLLLAAVGMLLIIGCGNVSILLLARGTARQQEFAVRAAIGASRGRMVRQLLTESLLLAVTGAGLGILFAYRAVALLKILLPRYAFAPEVAIKVNLPVLVFSAAVAVLTGVLFGLWPALQLSRPQLSQVMQSSTRRIAGGVNGRRMHGGLIAAQIALTLLLLAGAGAAMEGFLRLTHASLGYDPHNVMSVWIPLHDNTYTTWAERANYFAQLRAKLESVPGVSMAAISSNATPPSNGWRMKIEILGRRTVEEQDTLMNLVSAGYFATLRVPLLRGRLWSATEEHDGAPVAVINQTMARLYFPNGDAIGHSIKTSAFENRPPIIVSASEAGAWIQIVGVVADDRDAGLSNPIKPETFVPYTLSMWPSTQILVRSEVPPLSLLHTVREQLATVNPNQQTSDEVDDLETWIKDEPDWQREHLTAWLFGAFSVLALALAAVGLYSVVSYSVAQRTNEFGIRMALGAQRGHVMRLVFASTLVSVGSGIAAGLVLSVALDRILAQWAAGSARDPLILLGAVGVLSVVAGVACALPARRASVIDPMSALRIE